MLYVNYDTVVKAFHYEWKFINDLGVVYAPNWIKKELKAGNIYFTEDGELYISFATIPDKLVSIGDYIIKDSAGYLWVLDELTFKAFYEKLPKF